ncbi:MAG: glycoside hydrolase family 2 TIM barrel-domain containing protein, partial [Myxococcota bacterium]
MRTVSFVLISALAVPSMTEAAPVHVEVRSADGGHTLFRGGKPYVIKGAGGTGSLEHLARLGANSVRTWGAEDLGPRLDEAHRLGLTVTIGIWLGHERHGFDYTDDEQVFEQLERARTAVLAYRDHPALLMWGVGNEMEGFADGGNAAIWSAVNNVAALVKRLDPHHPTMTVLAEIGGKRVANVHRLCPDVDIVGVNSYGGVRSLADRYQAAGGKKPFVVTEFGPPGAWETSKTGWGAPVELSSVNKGRVYEAAYKSIYRSPQALGAYAFVWGNKREATATWFGLLLPDGTPLNPVDRLQWLWSGKYPKNRSPRITALVAKGATTQDPGAELVVEASVS